MDSFYVTLPSVASSDIFPDNSTANFTVHLSQPFHLDPSEWNVALHSFLVPTNWLTVEDSIYIYEAYNHDKFLMKEYTKQAHIPAGNYTNDGFVNTIKEKISSDNVHVEITSDRHLWLIVKNCVLVFSRQFGELFGIHDWPTDNNTVINANNTSKIVFFSFLSVSVENFRILTLTTK